KEIYKEKRKAFRLYVTTVFAGDDISEQQINKMWEASRDLFAVDTARILTRELLKKSKKTAEVTVDVPNEAVRFRTVLQMLLSGSKISAAQMDILAGRCARLTKDTVETICREEVISAYNQKVEAQQTDLQREQEFKDYFSQVVRFAADCASVPEEIVVLLYQAAQTLSPTDVTSILASHRTSWDAILARRNRCIAVTPGAPPAPPPPPRPAPSTERDSTGPQPNREATAGSNDGIVCVERSGRSLMFDSDALVAGIRGLKHVDESDSTPQNTPRNNASPETAKSPMGLLAERLRDRRKFIQPDMAESTDRAQEMFSAAAVAAAAAEDEAEEDNDFQSDDGW
ncbi:unnamed protein product, partial [Symbiodinium microadriaticum]